MPTNDPTTSGVYAIRCAANSKVYVGSAANFKVRWSHHRNRLAKDKHGNPKLQRAWNKHGAACFTFEVLEVVADKADLISKEQEWIDRLRSYNKRRGFNINPTAGSRLGAKHDEKTKAKIAKAQTGRTHTPETKALLSQAKAGFKHTPEAIAKITEASRTRKYTPEQRERLGAAFRGKKRPPETRAKMSAAQMGNTKNLGKKRPAETRARQSASLKGKGKGKVLSVEHRSKIGEGVRRSRRRTAIFQSLLPFPE